jgi:hypothetical protein
VPRVKYAMDYRPKNSFSTRYASRKVIFPGGGVESSQDAGEITILGHTLQGEAEIIIGRNTWFGDDTNTATTQVAFLSDSGDKSKLQEVEIPIIQ